MNVHRLLACALAAGALLGAGCGPAPQRLPDRVHITLIDATVAPSNEQGGAWDGPGKVPLDVIQGISQLLATAPARGRVETAAKTGAVLAELAHAAASGIAAPDPRGHADVLVAGASYRRELAECHDTFRPTWSGVTFDNVPLVEGVRMRVQLADADDIGSDDPIGTAELNYDDLIAALSTERVTQIRVADQTRGQLLFVGVSVVPRLGGRGRGGREGVKKSLSQGPALRR